MYSLQVININVAMSFQSFSIGHSNIIAVLGSSKHIHLMCHIPSPNRKLREKIDFFCFHDFLLIFSKSSLYSCVGSLELTCYMIFISQ